VTQPVLYSVESLLARVSNNKYLGGSRVIDDDDDDDYTPESLDTKLETPPLHKIMRSQ
jgi:hypothetical protein